MKRLGKARLTSRPRFWRSSVVTSSVRRARVMPTYISRRSSSSRSTVISSSSRLKGSVPSLTPTSTTCGHSRPLLACSVDSVTTFWSASPRSARLRITLMVCATSSTLFVSVCTWPLPSSAISPPQRRAIQSMKSSTLDQRAAATLGFSSLSSRCCSKPSSPSHSISIGRAASAPTVWRARYSRSFT